MTPANYTREEEDELLASLREGAQPACPRCGHALVEQSVPARGELPYVRDRLWLVCPGCRRSLVTDRSRVRRDR